MARRERFKDKATGETVDYAIDWSDRLGSDTISSSSWSISGPDTSLSVSIDSTSGDITSARITGGTFGKTYKVKNTIITTAGQTFDQTVLLEVSVR